MKQFTINGITYTAKPFDFNLICDLEEMSNAPITELQKKPISMARTYLAICMGASREEAGSELEQHIIGGGDVTELVEAMNDEIEDSGFFQAMTARNKKSTKRTKKSETIE